MNYNPLLVKNFLIGKIPFVKERTANLYGEYLSNRKFSKVISADDNETLSAYSMFNNYITDFIFDEGDITSDKAFSEKEWEILGLFLRALSEVEKVNLIHLYNCLYNYEGAVAKGSVVTGRVYTLYSSSSLNLELSVIDFKNNPLEIKILDTDIDYSEIKDPSTGGFLGIKLNSISKNHPIHFRVDRGDNPPGVLVSISIKFESEINILTSLIEGNYPGVDNLDVLIDPYFERRLIPGNLKIGEYSRKLVEFFAGTLITPLSSPRLVSSVSRELSGTSSNFNERVIEKTPGIFNKDGYMDRRIDL